MTREYIGALMNHIQHQSLVRVRERVGYSSLNGPTVSLITTVSELHEAPLNII